jgi:hypothetical protein
MAPGGAAAGEGRHAVRLVNPENWVALKPEGDRIPMGISEEAVFIYATAEDVTTECITRCGRVYPVRDASVTFSLDELAAEVAAGGDR